MPFSQTALAVIVAPQTLVSMSGQTLTTNNDVIDVEFVVTPVGNPYARRAIEAYQRVMEMRR